MKLSKPNNPYYTEADFSIYIKNINTVVESSQSFKIFLKILSDQITIHWTKGEIIDIKKKLIWLRDACADSSDARETFENLETTVKFYMETLGK